jgi:hypothetical protein
MSSIKGTNVAAPVVPFDTADVNPSHEARYGKGGYRTVASVAERNAIPAARREAGMLVYEQQSGKVWQLADGLEEWSEFVTSSAPDWADVTGKPSTFAPEAHAASHGAAGADAISIAASQVTSGELSASRLPAATANARGGVTIGTGLSISGDTVSVSRGVGTTLAMLRMNGSLADASASGITLTGGGGSFTAGRFSQAYSCDLANGPSSSGRPITDLTGGDWTIEAWVYRPTACGGYSGIVWLQNSAGIGANIYLNPDGTVVANNGGSGDASSTILVSVGAWTHIAVQWTGGAKKLFVNGAPAGDGSQQLAAGPYDLSIGWVPVSGSGFNSNLLIDEVRISRSAIYPAGGFSVPTEPLPANAGDAGEVRLVWSDDSRLTDAREPTPHTHPLSALTQSGASNGQAITWSGSAWVAGTVSAGSVAWNDVTGKPTFFSGAYADLSGKPTLFDGAYSSLTGRPTLGTAAASAASDFAAASHTHSLSSLTQSSATSGQVVSWNGSAWVATTPTSYSLPVATSSILGGVKQGSNTTIAADGTISVAAPFSGSYGDLTGRPALFDGAYSSLTGKPTLGTAAAASSSDFAAASHTHALSSLTQSGATTGQTITWSGTAWVASATVTSLPYSSITGTPSLATVATSGSYADLTNKPAIPSSYTLPTASSSVLGGIKVGSGLSIDGSSILSASYSYTLPAATASTLGGVIVGTGLGVTSGTVSVSYGSSSTTACVGNDSRLSDARTPTAHNQAWSTITSTPTTLSGYGITDAVSSSDSRLTDARTPTAHNQAWSTITSTPTTLSGYGITDAVGSSDSRLTNSRTPTAHTHGLADLTQSGATSGQIASWSGTAWVPVTPSSASVADGSITTAKLASDVAIDCGSYSGVAPNAPTGLTATAGVVGAANLAWTAPTLPGGAAITDYSIQYSTDSGSTWTSWSHSASTATTATVTSLSSVSTIFRVAGINSVGTGSYSSSSTAMTPAASKLSISRTNGTSTFTGSGTSASPFARSTKVAYGAVDGMLYYRFTASASGTFYWSLLFADNGDNDGFYVKQNSTTKTNLLSTGSTASGSFAVSAGDVMTFTADNTIFDNFANVSIYMT